MFKQPSFKQIFILALMLLTATVKATILHTSGTTLQGTSAPVIVTSTATASVAVMSDPSFKDVSVTDIVTLAVDHSSPLFSSTTGTYLVGLRVVRYDKNNVQIGTPDLPFLELKYQPFSASGQPYVDKSVYKFNDAYKYTITVQSMTLNGNAIANLPNNLFISSDILLERYINFSSAISTPVTMLPIAEKNLDCDTEGIMDELQIKWSTLAGAEEYQLEWTFVNDYLPDGSNKAASLLSYNFKNNSTRVSTAAATNYKLNLNFDRGYLIYRVRGIGRDFSNPSIPLPGAWNLADSNVVSATPALNVYTISGAYERNRNWQYSATYAEEGKRKEVISYFDGSLRNRQSVTKVNSDTTLIVGETIYDHQGRPAINVLPAPVKLPACSSLNLPLHYYPNLNNAENTAVEYSRLDFDLDNSISDSCNSKLNKMDTGTGTSRYYSPANTEKSGIQAFVPDAEKYPFSQIEYTPDNTGRIRRQGGVGPLFQLGTGHETKYFYGAPMQKQLDRLFGSEVGDASHYKKNVVMDANLQTSVTYLDQEGRTIATALAGDLPAGMDSLPTLNKLTTGVVEDLFNKDINGKSTKNTVSLKGDAIEFSSQLTVSYQSDYTFNYDMKIPQYESYPNGCLKSGVCFNCVYDLEISVTDDCGRTVPSSLAVNPIKKMIGRFTTDGSGNVVFSTNCFSDYTDAETFRVTLAAGNYTVTKRLTVNKAAKDYYIGEYFKTTNTPVQGTYVNLKPACNIKPYQQFVDAAMAKIDTTDCNVSCTACVASLQGSYATLELARDGFVADGKGTELDFDFLLEQCSAPCKEVSVCETNYQMMLLDVSPDGQYGEFRTKSNGSPADMNLSVFNPGNRLTKNAGATGNWMFPSIIINGKTYNAYIDKNGVRTKVKLINTGTSTNPVYSPEVREPAKVYFEAATQSYYTYPENLSYLSDFIARWDDNWAKSLVTYHPEYPYYKSCLDYNKKWPSYSLTSDAFDSVLVHCVRYADAKSLSYKLISTTISTDMILFNKPSQTVQDPFAFSANFGSYSAALNAQVTNYQNTGFSMQALAAKTARCGTRYGEASPATSCSDFGTGTDTVILNSEWNILKNLYLSTKQSLQKQHDEDSAKVNRACNACFSNPNYDPVAITGMISTPFFSSLFFDDTQPCGSFLKQFYIDKKKRFNASADVELPNKEQNDYQMYLQTNQTPMEINFQGFLNRLAKDAKLTTTISTLQPYTEFSQDLYMALNGPTTPLPPVYVPYTWQYGSLSGNLLTMYIQTGSTVKCTVSVTKDAAISNFNNIVGISQLKYDGMNGVFYKFKAVAAVANAAGSIRPYTYYPITGSSNFVLNGYTPNPVTVNKCKPNPLALDLARLWSAIALTNNLNSPGLSLNTTDYIPFLTKNIKNALGTTSNALTWKYVFGTPVTYELYEVTGKKMVMQVDSSNTTNFMRFVKMKNIDSNNGFRVTGTDVAGTSIGMIKGVVNIKEGAVTTPVNLGECGLPENGLCTGNEFQTGKDLLKLLKSVMLPKPFNTNPDLTKSVAYTPLLENYVGAAVGSSTTKYDYFNLNAANDYKELITYNMICKCQIKLWHKGKGNQLLKFADLTAINALIPYGPPSSDNNKYKFYLTASYPGSLIDTIYGESCFPLKECTNTIIADTAISPVRPYVTPCILNQLNMAVINAQNAYKKYSDSLLTDFSAKYTKHCLSAVENLKTTYNDREFHYTLYYYDQAGNLVKTIPPEGVVFDTAYFAINKDRSTNRHDHFTAHRLATTYTYNSLNQLVRQCVPDQDSLDIWEYNLSSGMDSRLKITSTQFISSTKGYLTGYIDFTGPPAFKRGYLYTTDDGGNTWTRMKNLVAADLKKIQMINATIGYAVGSNGTVMKTIDGGSSWDMLTVASTATFNDLIFNPNQTPNPLNGLIIGDNNTLFMTIDAGATWSATSGVTPLSSGLPAGITLTSITYDGGYFHMTGNLNGNGYIFRAQVGSFGTSSFNITLPWVTLSPASNTGIRSTDILKISMVDINRGFAVAVDGNLLKTVDKGLNWSAVPTGVSNEFRDICFLKMNGFPGNPLNGVAIIDSIPGKGLLYQTNDGGITWKQLSANDGNYYNAVYFVQTPGYRDKGYAVGTQLKRIVFKNNNFVLVNVPMPGTTPVDLKTACFTDPNNGWVASTTSAYFTHNAMSPAPVWAEVAASGFNIKKIYFGNAAQNSGLALTPDGAIYKITASGNTYVYTKISTSSDYFMDINAGATSVYALTKIGAPNVIRTVTRANVAALTAGGLTTPAPSGTVTSTNAAAFSTFAVEDSTESVVLVGGTDGRLFQGLTTPTTVAWNDYSRKYVPLPLYSIESPGAGVIFAAGAEGTLLQCTDQNTYRVIPTRTTVQYNTVKFNKTGFSAMTAVKGLITGNGGSMTRLNSTANNLISLLPMPVVATVDLHDVAIKNAASKAYVAGANGTLISIPDLDNPVPVIASPKPAGDFKGIAFTAAGNDVFAVGNNTAIYNYNGTSGTKINGTYTPALYDASFVNGMDGYVIGDKVIRYTPDGGTTWSYVAASPTVVMNAVGTYAPGKALIVGNSSYLGTVSGTSISHGATTGTCYDIEFSGSTGYMVGSVAQKISIVAGAPTYSSPPGTFPAGSTFRAVHIFPNGSFITVGDGGKIYCNKTAWVSIPLLSGTPVLKDVYFHDDRNGYAVGDGGAIYKCKAQADVFSYVAPPASPWTALTLAGTNGAVTPGNINLTVIAFTDRYKGFIGGYATTGTPINFARTVNDESKLFTSRFWYDALGRLVLSQNAKQYNRKSTQSGLSDYSYTFYDALGRIVEVGEKTDNATGTTFAGMFGDYIGGKFNPYVINGIGFSNWANTGSVRREVTRTTYDKGLGSFPQNIVPQNLRKRVSAVTYEEVNDGIDSTYQHGTFYSYDIHGNVKTLWQCNKQSASPSQQLKRMDYEYDLISGKVNLVRYQDGQADCFYHFYTYDADNRIKEVYTSTYPWKSQFINQLMVEKNKLWTKEAKYFYYAHGPLARVETGELISQGTDYVYTLQGWIKGVNSNILNYNNDIGNDGALTGSNTKAGRDAFGYSLSYYVGDYKPIDATNKWNNVPTRFEADMTGSNLLGARSNLYNGNIGAMVTNMSQPKLYSSAINEFPTLQPQGTAYKYDQLNRIKNVQAYTNVVSNVWGTTPAYANSYKNAFTYDGNGNILTQARYNAVGTRVDTLSYKYKRDGNGNLLRNQLTYVTDAVASNVATDDIDTQVDSNYRYDELGNLKRDLQEQILRIEWTVYGKIKKVIRTTASTKSDLEFKYDASGNRIAKIEKPHGSSVENGGVDVPASWKSTYYVRDAQGNVMGNYYYTYPGTASYKLIERNIYGSSRLGSENTQVNMLASTLPSPFPRTLGNKYFEGSNHLGNVLLVFTDKKVPRDDNNNGIIDYFQPEVLSCSDYTAFGAPMTERSVSSDKYRYGFNGKEKDDEVVGAGNQYDYGFRIYNPRLGKFLSVDPLTKKYAYLSPFAFAENDVIRCTDLDGLEKNAIVRWYDNGKYVGSTFIKVPDNKKVEPGNSGTLIVNLDVNMKPTSSPQSTQFYNETTNTVFFKVNGENKMAGGKIVKESKNSWENGRIKAINGDPKAGGEDYNVPDVKIDFEDPSNVSTPTNPEDYGVFKRTLKDNPEFKLNIEGNASKADGVSEATNIQISKDRAKTVKTDILTGGANPSQITTKGSGSDNAITPNNPSDRNAIIHTDLPINHDYD